MNSFEKCRAIEEESNKDVYNFLTERYDYVVHTDEFKNNRTYQSYYGDYLCVLKDEKVFIEVKAEVKNKYNNFYLETWSNKPQNIGWFKKCKADVILYHFLEDNVIYLFDLVLAQKFIKNSDGVYPEKPQSKYSQMNKAYGLCVPINVIMKHAGLLTINLNGENK
jgi:hypothetical protein